MGSRDLQESAKARKQSSTGMSKPKGDVFDTHGNEAIAAHIAENRKAAAEPDQASVLDTAAKASELAVDPSERRSAVGEVRTFLLKLEESPTQLAEIVRGKDSNEDQTLALLDFIGAQISMPTAEILASLSMDDLAFELGNMVVSTAALDAPETSPEIAKLGALAPVLFELLLADLERSEGLPGDESLDQATTDASHLALAIADADAQLQFL